MAIISIFNNKGGVGKTTLLYHLGHALAEKGKKVLFLDLDPQSNLTFNAMHPDIVVEIWEKEDKYINDFKNAKNEDPNYNELISSPRSIHFILKPIEDGLDYDIDIPVYPLNNNIDIIPGRLSLQMFERTISKAWADAFIGMPGAIRTISAIRSLAEKYTLANKYDYVLIDTSPSLGDLNKITISLSDFFFIPCTPDIFSIYGIRNIGATLKIWGKEFHTLFKLLPATQRKYFPEEIVKLIGYTIYKAQKRSDARNSLEIPQAHYTHVVKIPIEIEKEIPVEFICKVDMKTSIGKNVIIYSHNTFPAMSQKYNVPMWKIPNCSKIESADQGTINSNSAAYKLTLESYIKFAEDIIKRTSR